ncbi:MAG: biopolymer transporter ExbD, partial [Smithellaceae bacterium]
MRFSRRRNNQDKALSEINVTPLVDVMLVLLIIFMVTAPMLSMGIDVNLPRVQSKSVDVTEEKLILTVNENREIYLNKVKIPLAELNSKLEAIFSS